MKKEKFYKKFQEAYTALAECCIENQEHETKQGTVKCDRLTLEMYKLLCYAHSNNIELAERYKPFERSICDSVMALTCDYALANAMDTEAHIDRSIRFIVNEKGDILWSGCQIRNELIHYAAIQHCRIMAFFNIFTNAKVYGPLDCEKIICLKGVKKLSDFFGISVEKIKEVYKVRQQNDQVGIFNLIEAAR